MTRARLTCTYTRRSVTGWRWGGRRGGGGAGARGGRGGGGAFAGLVGWAGGGGGGARCRGAGGWASRRGGGRGAADVTRASAARTTQSAEHLSDPRPLT